MFLGAAGLRTHIWNNNLRSVLLLAGFPLLLILLGYAVALIWIAMTGEGIAAVSAGGKATSYYGDPTLWQSMQAALYLLPNIALVSSVLAGIWFIIAWFSHQAIINAATGAKSVERKDETRLYNLLENLCISRGLNMPKLAIIESEGRNAFASGLREDQYTITVTRGLMDMLDDAELEGVLAHELSHIRHADVRLLVISVIFVGIISFVVQLAFRGMLHGGLRGGSRRGGGSKNAGALIVIAMVFIGIAYLLAIVIRFTLSRRREYMADAGAVELTKNPDAMISALMKISGHSTINRAPEEVREMFIENPKSGFMGVFATHPPMDKRIDMLVEHAGGKRPHPTVPTASVPDV
jgi:heat shock protein HtpX